MKTIKINGKQYPCRVTMGAMLRFKRETGHDVSKLGHDDIGDLITLLWCCVVSASKADSVKFNMDLLDFADRLSPETLTDFFAQLDQDEKKTVEDKTSPPTS